MSFRRGLRAAVVLVLSVLSVLLTRMLPVHAAGSIPACGAIVVNSGQNLYSMNTSTGALTQFGGVSPLLLLTTAIGEDPTTGDIWYSSAAGDFLGRYDGTTSVNWPTPLSGLSVSRMAFNSAGVGYFTDSLTAHLYAFVPHGLAAPTITDLGVVTATSGPALSTLQSGDFAFDSSGRIYAIFTSGGIKMLYNIDVAHLTATPILSLAAVTTGTVASFAFNAAGLGFFVDQGTAHSFSVNVGNGAIVDIGPTAPGPGSINDAASCVTPTLTPNLATTLAVAPAGSQRPGTTLTYTVTLTNTGSAPTDGTQLTVPIPAGTTYVAGTTTLNGAAVADNAGVMPYATGASVNSASAQGGVVLTEPTAGTNAAVVTFSVLVNNPYYSAASISEQGSVIYQGGVSSSNTVTTAIQPTLSLSKSHIGSLTVGGTGSYTLTVSNVGGASTSAPITLSDALPANLTIGTGFAAPPGWTCSAVAGTPTWSCTSNAGTVLAPTNGPTGAQAFNLPVVVGIGTPAGTNAISNSAAAYGGGDTVHVVAGNALTAADPTTIVGVPSLGLSKVDNSAGLGGSWSSATVGATYTLTVTNSGPVSTSGTITLTDPLPTGVTVGAGFAAPAGWSCTAPAGATSLTCASNGGTVLAGGGGNATFSLPVTVGAGAAAGPNTNTAAVYGGGDIVHTAAGSAASGSVTTTIVGPAHPALTVAKADNGPWTIGQSGASYTINLTNSGTVATAGTYTVTDALPANVTLNGAPTGTNWNCAGSSVSSIVCTATAVLGAGVAAPAISAPVTVGAGTPTGVNAISNVASAYGGGDAVHASAGTAATSAADQTTINSTALLAAGTNGNVVPGVSAVDTFTLTNAGTQAGTITIIAPVISSGGTPLAATGFVLNGGGTVYPSLAVLQAAIAALGPTAANGTLQVGVEYAVPAGATPGQTISDTLAAHIIAGGLTSADIPASVTDTVRGPILHLTKSDNGPWTIGQTGATYTLTLSNTGNTATTGTVTLTDSLPSSVVASGVPTGTNWTCVAAGVSFSCTTTTAIGAGAAAAPLVAPVSIGAGTPTGTNAISNTAGAYGGGDPVHATPGTAVASAADLTTILSTTTLSISGINANVTPGSTALDTFTLTNTSAVAGTLAVVAPVVSSAGTPIAPSGFLLNGGGTVYPSWATLQAAIAALGPTAAGGTLHIGVQYPVPAGATSGQLISDTITANITAGGVTSSNVAASVSDSVSSPILHVTKTDNGPWTIGQTGALYTLTVSNTGNTATTGTITLTDSLPTNVVANGAPTGAIWTCTPGGATFTCTTTTAIAAGAAAAPVVAPVSVGAGTPTGLNAISNIAAAYGGGDPAHATPGTAASSAVDRTTIVAATLSVSGTHANVLSATTATDTFTITNTSAQAGSITLGAATIADAGGTAIATAGYLLNGGATVYPTSGALNAAVAALGPLAAGQTILVGVRYQVPNGPPSPNTFTLQLPASITVAGVTSAPVIGIATDTSSGSAQLSVQITDNGPWLIGQTAAAYSIVVRNTGGAATSGTVTVVATLPAALTFSSVPTGSGWSCTTIGGSTLTCTSTTAAVAGAALPQIRVPVTLGSATAVGVNAISIVASAYGGADLLHANVSTAAQSAADVTTINGLALSNVPDSNLALLANTTVNDSFTLTNRSSLAGTFVISAPVLSSPLAAIAPIGYVLNHGTVVLPTLAALQSAINVLGPTPSGGKIVVGVVYTVPAAAAGQTITDQLTAAIAANGVTSAPLSAAFTEMVTPQPRLSNVAAGSSTAVPGVTTTDSFTLTNLSGQPGRFGIPLAPIITGPGGALIASGFLIGGVPVSHAGMNTSWQDLAAALGRLAPVAAGATLAIGVQYVVPAGNLNATVSDQLGAVIQAGGMTSSPVSATAISSLIPRPTLTNTPVVATQTIVPGRPATDVFTLTNTCAQSGTFAVVSATQDGSLAAVPSAFVMTVNGTSSSYPTLAALNAALAGSAAAAGASVAVGVQTNVGANATTGATSSTTLGATFAAGNVTSPAAVATIVDTVHQAPAIVVTGNTSAIGQVVNPGQGTLDVFTLTNKSPVAGFFAMPADASIVGPAGAIAVTGYTIDSTNAGKAQSVNRSVRATALEPLTLAAVNAQLARITVVPGGSVMVDVAFAAPPSLVPGAVVTTQLSSTITIHDASGGAGVTSAVATASAVNVVPGALSISKTVNAPWAQAGDVVTYAVDITNHASAAASNVIVTDYRPRGFSLMDRLAVATIGGQAVALTITQHGSATTFGLSGSLAAGATAHLVYASALDPDALRGSGRNVALVTASLNGATMQGGPATATVVVRPGIFTSCGTIVGRVFVDTRGDGRQVPGEPGIPNAVIMLDDGTRVEADANGLFSVPCAHPGWRAGTLDLRSIPGYKPATNASRLDGATGTIGVQLEPGGTVRMNFGVIPDPDR